MVISECKIKYIFPNDKIIPVFSAVLRYTCYVFPVKHWITGKLLFIHFFYLTLDLCPLPLRQNLVVSKFFCTFALSNNSNVKL